MKISRVLRSIAGITCCIFTFTTIAQAAPHWGIELDIPTSYGQVVERHVSEASNTKTVVIVQDAHENFNAQHNIAHIIESLIPESESTRLLIAVEGAQGDINLNALKSLPLSEARRKASLELIKAGYLSGAEHASIVSDRDMRLWGAEDRELLIKNVRSFQSVMQYEEDIAHFTDYVDARLSALKAEEYTGPLKEFSLNVSSFQSGALSFEHFASLLNAALKETGVDDSELTHWLLYNEIRERFNALNEVKVRDAVETIAAYLGAHDAEWWEAETKGNFSLPEALLDASSMTRIYQRYLFSAPQGESARIPALEPYVAIHRLYSLLDYATLLEETNLLSYKVQSAYADSRSALSLIETSHFYERIMKIITLKAVRSDVSRVDTQTETACRALLDALQSLGIAITDATRLHMLSAYSDALRFYTDADARDRVLAKNIISKMEQEGIDRTLLVVGGYHTAGITQYLKQEGISYVLVRPHIGLNLEKIGYAERMTGALIPLATYLNSYLTVIFSELAKQNSTAFKVLKDTYYKSYGSVILEDPLLASRLSLLIPQLNDPYLQEYVHGILALRETITREVASSHTPETLLNIDDVISAGRTRITGFFNSNRIRKLLTYDKKIALPKGPAQSVENESEALTVSNGETPQSELIEVRPARNVKLLILDSSLLSENLVSVSAAATFLETVLKSGKEVRMIHNGSYNALALKLEPYMAKIDARFHKKILFLSNFSTTAYTWENGTLEALNPEKKRLLDTFADMFNPIKRSVDSALAEAARRLNYSSTRSTTVKIVSADCFLIHNDLMRLLKVTVPPFNLPLVYTLPSVKAFIERNNLERAAMSEAIQKLKLIDKSLQIDIRKLRSFDSRTLTTKAERDALAILELGYSEYGKKKNQFFQKASIISSIFKAKNVIPENGFIDVRADNGIALVKNYELRFDALVKRFIAEAGVVAEEVYIALGNDPARTDALSGLHPEMIEDVEKALKEKELFFDTEAFDALLTRLSEYEAPLFELRETEEKEVRSLSSSARDEGEITISSQDRGRVSRSERELFNRHAPSVKRESFVGRFVRYVKELLEDQKTLRRERKEFKSLCEALCSENPAEREAAILTMKHYDATIVPDILKLLKRDEWYVKLAVLDILGSLTVSETKDRKKIISALFKEFAHRQPDTYVQVMVRDAIKAMGTESARIVERYLKNSVADRRTAIALLVHIGGSVARHALLNHIKNEPNKDIRYALIANMSEYSEDAVKSALEWLDARSLKNRIAAVELLTGLGTIDTIYPLLYAMEDKNAKVRVLAAEALAALFAYHKHTVEEATHYLQKNHARNLNQIDVRMLDSIIGSKSAQAMYKALYHTREREPRSFGWILRTVIIAACMGALAFSFFYFREPLKNVSTYVLHPVEVVESFLAPELNHSTKLLSENIVREEAEIGEYTTMYERVMAEKKEPWLQVMWMRSGEEPFDVLEPLDKRYLARSRILQQWNMEGGWAYPDVKRAYEEMHADFERYINRTISDEAKRKEYVSVLNIRSSFRSYAYQDSLYKENVAQFGLEQRKSSPAGMSEHHRNALDFMIETDMSDIQRTVFNWLSANAQRYGFMQSYKHDATAEANKKQGKEYVNKEGVMPESWHWSFNPLYVLREMPGTLPQPGSTFEALSKKTKAHKKAITDFEKHSGSALARKQLEKFFTDYKASANKEKRERIVKRFTNYSYFAIYLALRELEKAPSEFAEFACHALLHFTSTSPSADPLVRAYILKRVDWYINRPEGALLSGEFWDDARLNVVLQKKALQVTGKNNEPTAMLQRWLDSYIYFVQDGTTGERQKMRDDLKQMLDASPDVFGPVIFNAFKDYVDVRTAKNWADALHSEEILRSDSLWMLHYAACEILLSNPSTDSETLAHLALYAEEKLPFQIANGVYKEETLALTRKMVKERLEKIKETLPEAQIQSPLSLDAMSAPELFRESVRVFDSTHSQSELYLSELLRRGVSAEIDTVWGLFVDPLAFDLEKAHAMVSADFTVDMYGMFQYFAYQFFVTHPERMSDEQKKGIERFYREGIDSKKSKLKLTPSEIEKTRDLLRTHDIEKVLEKKSEVSRVSDTLKKKDESGDIQSVAQIVNQYAAIISSPERDARISLRDVLLRHTDIEAIFTVLKPYLILSTDKKVNWGANYEHAWKMHYMACEILVSRFDELRLIPRAEKSEDPQKFVKDSVRAFIERPSDKTIENAVLIYKGSQISITQDMLRDLGKAFLTPTPKKTSWFDSPEKFAPIPFAYAAGSFSSQVLDQITAIDPVRQSSETLTSKKERELETLLRRAADTDQKFSSTTQRDRYKAAREIIQLINSDYKNKGLLYSLKEQLRSHNWMVRFHVLNILQYYECKQFERDIIPLLHDAHVTVQDKALDVLASLGRELSIQELGIAIAASTLDQSLIKKAEAIREQLKATIVSEAVSADASARFSGLLNELGEAPSTNARRIAGDKLLELVNTFPGLRKSIMKTFYDLEWKQQYHLLRLIRNSGDPAYISFLTGIDEPGAQNSVLQSMLTLTKEKLRLTAPLYRALNPDVATDLMYTFNQLIYPVRSGYFSQDILGKDQLLTDGRSVSRHAAGMHIREILEKSSEKERATIIALMHAYLSVENESDQVKYQTWYLLEILRDYHSPESAAKVYQVFNGWQDGKIKEVAALSLGQVGRKDFARYLARDSETVQTEREKGFIDFAVGEITNGPFASPRARFDYYMTLLQNQNATIRALAYKQMVEMIYFAQNKDEYYASLVRELMRSDHNSLSLTQAILGIMHDCEMYGYLDTILTFTRSPQPAIKDQALKISSTFQDTIDTYRVSEEKMKEHVSSLMNISGAQNAQDLRDKTKGSVDAIVALVHKNPAYMKVLSDMARSSVSEAVKFALIEVAGRMSDVRSIDALRLVAQEVRDNNLLRDHALGAIAMALYRSGDKEGYAELSELRGKIQQMTDKNDAFYALLKTFDERAQKASRSSVTLDFDEPETFKLPNLKLFDAEFVAKLKGWGTVALAWLPYIVGIGFLVIMLKAIFAPNRLQKIGSSIRSLVRIIVTPFRVIGHGAWVLMKKFFLGVVAGTFLIFQTVRGKKGHAEKTSPSREESVSQTDDARSEAPSFAPESATKPVVAVPDTFEVPDTLIRAKDGIRGERTALFSQTGRYVAYRNDANDVDIYDLKNSSDTARQSFYGAKRVLFGFRDEYVVVLRDKAPHVYNFEDNSLRTLSAADSGVKDLAVAHDGIYFLLENQTVAFSESDLNVKNVIIENAQNAHEMAVSFDGAFIAVIDTDGALSISQRGKDEKTSFAPQSVSSHFKKVYQGKKANVFVAVTADKKVYVIDPIAKKSTYVVRLTSSLTDLEVSKDATTVYLAAGMKLYRILIDQEGGVHESNVKSIVTTFALDEKRGVMFVGTRDGFIRIHDMSDFEIMHELKYPSKAIASFVDRSSDMWYASFKDGSILRLDRLLAFREEAIVSDIPAQTGERKANVHDQSAQKGKTFGFVNLFAGGALLFATVLWALEMNGMPVPLPIFALPILFTVSSLFLLTRVAFLPFIGSFFKVKKLFQKNSDTRIDMKRFLRSVSIRGAFVLLVLLIEAETAFITSSYFVLFNKVLNIDATQTTVAARRTMDPKKMSDNDLSGASRVEGIKELLTKDNYFEVYEKTVSSPWAWLIRQGVQPTFEQHYSPLLRESGNGYTILDDKFKTHAFVNYGMIMLDRKNRVMAAHKVVDNAIESMNSVPSDVNLLVAAAEGHPYWRTVPESYGPILSRRLIALLALKPFEVPLRLIFNDSIPFMASIAGGGSMIPVQEKKLQGSPGRSTNDSLLEKIRQMHGAGLHLYRDGFDTRQTRKEIMVSFLNAVDLGTQKLGGTIHDIRGFADAMCAYFGVTMNELFRALQSDDIATKARAQKQIALITSMFPAPSYYLTKDDYGTKDEPHQFNVNNLTGRANMNLMAVLKGEVDVPREVDGSPLKGSITQETYDEARKYFTEVMSPEVLETLADTYLKMARITLEVFNKQLQQTYPDSSAHLNQMIEREWKSEAYKNVDEFIVLKDEYLLEKFTKHLAQLGMINETTFQVLKNDPYQFFYVMEKLVRDTKEYSRMIQNGEVSESPFVQELRIRLALPERVGELASEVLRYHIQDLQAKKILSEKDAKRLIKGYCEANAKNKYYNRVRYFAPEVYEGFMLELKERYPEKLQMIEDAISSYSRLDDVGQQKREEYIVEFLKIVKDVYVPSVRHGDIRDGYLWNEMHARFKTYYIPIVLKQLSNGTKAHKNQEEQVQKFFAFEEDEFKGLFDLDNPTDIGTEEMLLPFGESEDWKLLFDDPAHYENDTILRPRVVYSRQDVERLIGEVLMSEEKIPFFTKKNEESYTLDVSVSLKDDFYARFGENAVAWDEFFQPIEDGALQVLFKTMTPPEMRVAIEKNKVLTYIEKKKLGELYDIALKRAVVNVAYKLFDEKRTKNFNNMQTIVATTYDYHLQKSLQDLFEQNNPHVSEGMRSGVYLQRKGYMSNTEGLIAPHTRPNDLEYALYIERVGKDRSDVIVDYDTSREFNTGGHMNMGSTAKVRVLIQYYEYVKDLYELYHTKQGGARIEAMKNALVRFYAPRNNYGNKNIRSRNELSDTVLWWFSDYMSVHPSATLEEVMRASAGKKYPARPYSPGYYTGKYQDTVWIPRNDSEIDLNGDGIEDPYIPVSVAIAKSANNAFVHIFEDVRDGIIANYIVNNVSGRFLDLEQKAMTEIHDRWVKLGYPAYYSFDKEAASLQWALGTATDTPYSLVRLMEILKVGESRSPVIVEDINMLPGTPFNKQFRIKNPKKKSVEIDPLTRTLVREGLQSVVQGFTYEINGTQYKDYGTAAYLEHYPHIKIIGKTGSAPGLATFMFEAGDLTGCLSIYIKDTIDVNGVKVKKDPNDYTFKSKLATRILYHEILPLLHKEGYFKQYPTQSRADGATEYPKSQSSFIRNSEDARPESIRQADAGARIAIMSERRKDILESVRSFTGAFMGALISIIGLQALGVNSADAAVLASEPVVQVVSRDIPVLMYWIASGAIGLLVFGLRALFYMWQKRAQTEKGVQSEMYAAVNVLRPANESAYTEGVHSIVPETDKRVLSPHSNTRIIAGIPVEYADGTERLSESLFVREMIEELIENVSNDFYTLLTPFVAQGGRVRIIARSFDSLTRKEVIALPLEKVLQTGKKIENNPSLRAHYLNVLAEDTIVRDVWRRVQEAETSVQKAFSVFKENVRRAREADPLNEELKTMSAIFDRESERDGYSAGFERLMREWFILHNSSGDVTKDALLRAASESYCVKDVKRIFGDSLFEAESSNKGAFIIALTRALQASEGASYYDFLNTLKVLATRDCAVAYTVCSESFAMIEDYREKQKIETVLLGSMYAVLDDELYGSVGRAQADIERARHDVELLAKNSRVAFKAFIHEDLIRTGHDSIVRTILEGARSEGLDLRIVESMDDADMIFATVQSSVPERYHPKTYSLSSDPKVFSLEVMLLPMLLDKVLAQFFIAQGEMKIDLRALNHSWLVATSHGHIFNLAIQDKLSEALRTAIQARIFQQAA